MDDGQHRRHGQEMDKDGQRWTTSSSNCPCLSMPSMLSIVHAAHNYRIYREHIRKL